LSKVILQGFIIVPKSDLELVRHELVIHKKLTLQESGCLIFSVKVDDVDEQKLFVYEEFVDQAAFDHHQSRSRLSQWAEITKNVTRHYNISRG